jgi:hypothetical protein
MMLCDCALSLMLLGISVPYDRGFSCRLGMQPVVSASSSSLDTAAACVDSPHPFRVAVVDVEAVGGHDSARTIGQQLSTDLRLAGRIALVMVTCQINAQLEAKAKWAGFAQVRTFRACLQALISQHSKDFRSTPWGTEGQARAPLSASWCVHCWGLPA